MSAPVGAPVVAPPSMDQRLRRWLMLSAAFVLVSLAITLIFQWSPDAEPRPSISPNVFEVLFARNEPLGVALGLLFLAVFAMGLERRWFDRSWSWLANPEDRPRQIYLIAAAVLTVCGVGCFLVMHNFPLAMDEYAANWQAQIFLSGNLTAEVPKPWNNMGLALKPVFIALDPATDHWRSTYLPVYSLFRAFFMAFSIAPLTNAFFSAGSILAIAGVARRIWPDQKAAPLAAVLLLASSAQFLITGMTSYAMPAHLCLNMFWLWLYLQPEKRIFWLTPFVGIIALGLHQPFFHALFAVPFLFRLVLQRRWPAVVGFAAIYLLGIACWFAWWRAFMPGFSDDGGAGAFQFWTMDTARWQTLGLVLLFSWQSALALLLVLVALPRVRKFPPVLQDIAAGLVLTAVFYSFVIFGQGHGWGNRYLFNVLGNLILLATAGWVFLAQEWSAARAGRLLAVGTIFALAIQFPVRCFQAEAFVRPFATSYNFIREQKVGVVLIDHLEAWYSLDLVRNEPFLDNEPKIAHLRRFTPDQLESLSRILPIRVIHGTDLAKFGMVPTDPAVLKRLRAKPPTEPPKAEPSKTEPSQTEPPKTEQAEVSKPK